MPIPSRGLLVYYVKINHITVFSYLLAGLISCCFFIFFWPTPFPVAVDLPKSISKVARDVWQAHSYNIVKEIFIIFFNEFCEFALIYYIPNSSRAIEITFHKQEESVFNKDECESFLNSCSNISVEPIGETFFCNKSFPLRYMKIKKPEKGHFYNKNQSFPRRIILHLNWIFFKCYRFNQKLE